MINRETTISRHMAVPPLLEQPTATDEAAQRYGADKAEQGDEQGDLEIQRTVEVDADQHQQGEALR